MQTEQRLAWRTRSAYQRTNPGHCWDCWSRGQKSVCFCDLLGWSVNRHWFLRLHALTFHPSRGFGIGRIAHCSWGQKIQYLNCLPKLRRRSGVWHSAAMRSAQQACCCCFAWFSLLLPWRQSSFRAATTVTPARPPTVRRSDLPVSTLPSWLGSGLSRKKAWLHVNIFAAWWSERPSDFDASLPTVMAESSGNCLSTGWTCSRQWSPAAVQRLIGVTPANAPGQTDWGIPAPPNAGVLLCLSLGVTGFRFSWPSQSPPTRQLKQAIEARSHLREDVWINPCPPSYRRSMRYVLFIGSWHLTSGLYVRFRRRHTCLCCKSHS